MSEKTDRRHDISDRVWQRIEPPLSVREGVWGGRPKNNRQPIQ